MQCPDCGGELKQTNVVEVDSSYRCEKCGGVRVMGWVINKIAEDGKLKIKAKGDAATKIKLAGGQMPKCPEDQMVMVAQSGEELPPELPVWKCGKCSWWWLPGDSVFELGAAFDVKREFTKRWKKPSPFRTFALPVVLTALLFAGLTVGNQLVRQNNSIRSQASEIEQLSVRYKDGGVAEVKFVSNVEVGTIVYRRESLDTWQMANVIREGEFNVVEIPGVSPGDVVWVSIGPEVRKITVGNSY